MSFAVKRSVDIGFGFTKALDQSGKDLMFPSVTGSSRPLHQNIISTGGLDSNPNIIYTDSVGHKDYADSVGKTLFVGDLAIRQSPFKYFSLKESKPQDSRTRILLEVALASLSNAPSEQVILGTGLPVTFYFEQKESMEKLCTRNHHINIMVNGIQMERDIEVIQTHVFPQPLGSVMNWMLDSQSAIRSELKSAMSGTIGVVDIGFFTADYLLLDRLEPISDHSRSTRSGISTALKSLSDSGIDLPLYQLNREIQLGRYRSESAVAFRGLSEQIATEIETFWPHNVQTVIVSGGGGSVLRSHLAIQGEALQNATYLSDPNMANVYGYMKMLRRTGR